MTTNSLTIVLIIIACILLLPLGIAVIGGAFGIVVSIVGALIGAIFGLAGAIIGAVFSFIGWIFELIFGCFWNLNLFDANVLTISIVIALVLVLSKSRIRR